MTDSIDLDELGIEEEDDASEEGPRRGDWFWQGEGDPDDEPSLPADDVDEAEDTDDSEGSEAGADDPGDRITAAPDPREAADAAADTNAPTPRVPRQGDDRPVGIPKETGGAGGVAAVENAGERAELSEAEKNDSGEFQSEAAAASGPHGGGTDEMTTAFTLRALGRLENLHVALSDANGYSDWIGIVGDVDAHVINKFQRDNGVDADFFNGTGTGPADRLADIDHHSMFYADRMVVLGCADEAWIAEDAGWEFVDIEDAAAKSGWALTEE
jgi:hypothetical protein